MSELFLDTVRTFAAREIEPAAAGIDATDHVPGGLMSAMTAVGLLSIVEDGLELPGVLEVVEIVARASAPVAMLVVAPDLVGPRSAPESQRATELAGTTTGLRGVYARDLSSADRHRELVLGVAAVAIGVCARAHELAADYAATRTAFGRLLSEFPVLAMALAEMVDTIEVSRALLSRAVASDDPTAAHSAAKNAAASAVSVAFSAIQLHGGYGYMLEYGVERLARDAISLRALVSGLTTQTAADSTDAA